MRFRVERQAVKTPGAVRAFAAAATILVGCGVFVGDEAEQARAALSGTITISGTIEDAIGLGLPGVEVHLLGPPDHGPVDHVHGDPHVRLAVAQSGVDGSYSFGGLQAGSYIVRPDLDGCAFEPKTADLDHVSADTTQDFSGSGSSCGGTRQVGFGATSGAFTLRGHVRDAAGDAVVGAQITLSGAAQAARFSDFTGAYTFHVDAGSYSLDASGACAISPADVAFDSLGADQVQDFTATSDTCVVAVQSGVTPTGSILTLEQSGQVLGATYTHLEVCDGPADALARLQDIATEASTTSRSLTIDGFSAIERQAVFPVPGPVDLDLDGPGLVLAAQPLPINITSAIAVGDTVIRFETQVPSNASPAAIQGFFIPARNFDPSTLSGVHGSPPPALSLAQDILPAAPPPRSVPPISPAVVVLGPGEIEIAVSDSSNAIVYAAQNQIYQSVDNGLTASLSKLNLEPPVMTNGRGDPTVGVGAPGQDGKQAFWYAQLLNTGTTMVPVGMTTTSVTLLGIGVAKSTDDGKTFDVTSTAVPVDCASTKNLNCVLPDMPQMAVDRLHQVELVPGGQRFDQVYLVWRNFNDPTNNSAKSGVGVACSADEGTNPWTIDVVTLAGSSNDFPRVTVAQDGSVLVVYSVGDNVDSAYDIKVQKFTSCSNGLQAVGKPVPVASAYDVGTLVGLDRPALGNFSIAADLSPSLEQRAFVTYVGRNNNGSDVHVIESKDGAAHWMGDVTVNSSSFNDRYFPWICATEGTAYVTWYDRRNATSDNTPDLTSYHRASVSDSAGKLQAGTDFPVSGVDDPQCASGFSAAVEYVAEEKTCGQDLPGDATHPVFAGTCCPMGTQANGTGGGFCCTSTSCTKASSRCDFRFSSTCAANETCMVSAAESGVPKFGDYNGNACARGVLYMAWTSATAPAGLACRLNGISCAKDEDCCTRHCGGGLCATATCNSTGTACGGVTTVNCCSNNCVGGTCSANALTCLQTGAACTSDGAQCCTGNCQGGQCLPTVAVFGASSVLGACTSGPADPNRTFEDLFDIDTGKPGEVGNDYGNGACTDQLLIELDLTSPALQGHGIFIAGRWSSTLPPTPCDEQANMVTYVFDGTEWLLWDTVNYLPEAQGPICSAVANPHAHGLDGTSIEAANHFQKARIAVQAIENGAKVPLLVFAQFL
jgi:hypothetical protein